MDRLFIKDRLLDRASRGVGIGSNLGTGYKPPTSKVGSLVSSAINTAGQKLIGGSFNQRINPITRGGVKTYDFSQGGLAKTGAITTGANQRAKLLFKGGTPLRLTPQSTFVPKVTTAPGALSNLGTVLQGGSLDIDAQRGAAATRG